MVKKPETALISVSDKTGIVEFAAKLHENGVKIVSTGGTAKMLAEAGLPISEISNFTGSPEILDGRVKTLHPKVHGGILNIRDNEKHQETMKNMGFTDIDMVVVNLYPFEATVANPDVAYDDAIENIDIGGPSMIRSAAKNHKFVTILTDSKDYETVLGEIENEGGTTLETRKKLAAKAFSHTALYDSVIATYFNKQLGIKFPEIYTTGGRKAQDLRYGENPHQESAFYVQPLITEPSVSLSRQLHGKELSFNNIIDINASVECVKEFAEPAAVIVKHTNPCGVASDENLLKAYEDALACDPVSAFGGIVAVNREVDADLAAKLAEIFLEVICAPAFSLDALTILTKKKNIRLMETGDLDAGRDAEFDTKKVTGGLLLQDRDLHTFDDISELNVPTKRRPTAEELEGMAFGWKVAKHVKSNAIIYTRGSKTVGVGAGQMSRVDSSKIAVSKAQSSLDGCVMSSDAFFPFRDSVDEAAKNGITAIISPGGSVRDDEVIAAADEHGIAMVFTGVRHFKH